MKWKLWKKAVEVIKSKTSLEISEKYKFPCSDNKCLVRVSCSKACEKIVTDEYELTDLFTKYRCCPDCGSEKFYEGPSGGMAQNMKCAGCGHWFNLGLPLFAQRIHFTASGRFER